MWSRRDAAVQRFTALVAERAAAPDCAPRAAPLASAEAERQGLRSFSKRVRLICAACLYACARSSGLPVTLRRVAESSGLAAREIDRQLRALGRLGSLQLPTEPPSLALLDLVGRDHASLAAGWERVVDGTVETLCATLSWSVPSPCNPQYTAVLVAVALCLRRREVLGSMAPQTLRTLCASLGEVYRRRVRQLLRETRALVEGARVELGPYERAVLAGGCRSGDLVRFGEVVWGVLTTLHAKGLRYSREPVRSRERGSARADAEDLARLLRDEGEAGAMAALLNAGI